MNSMNGLSDLVTPIDGMKLTRDTTLAPGVYFLPNGIELAADNIALNGNGALLIGDGFKGRGVWATQKIGLTIKNLNVERYYHGIHINASANVRVQGCTVTRTHELAGQDTFLDVWLDRKDAYGGGIFFSGVQDGFIEGNDVQHQQNGIMLYGCNKIEIARNNASFNSGYGMLLYESSENEVIANIADYCSRTYHVNAEADVLKQRYHIGGDGAALVMMCGSSKNIIKHNKLRASGDGVFLGGFHKDYLKVPCNDNLFENNDGSHSPNIAFEATFSQRNVFRNNRAERCKFGFWLGYSTETLVEANEIKDNWVAGLAIEQGHKNRIENNTFARNRDGAQFWAGAKPAFGDWYPECIESYETTIANNTFVRHDTAVQVWTGKADGASVGARCHHFVIANNELTDNRVGIQLDRVHHSSVYGNRVFENVEAGIKLIGCAEMNVAGNVMERA
jgi:parallel beta-helix repeat protein